VSEENGATQPTRGVWLCGVRLDAVTEAECVDLIIRQSKHGRGGWVVTHNLDHLRRLMNDRDFAPLCEQATLRVADGMPLIWASRIQRTPLPERVAGSNLIFSLSDAAARAGRSIFLLGGDGETAILAAAALQERCPGLRIAGLDRAPHGFDDDPEHMEHLRLHLEETAPDIVFVALGSPKQERIISRLRPAAPNAWWLGVGISFSFACGDVRRAPGWMQALGLEWAHRLFQEPRRLWRRYLVEGIPFALGLMFRAARTRSRGASVN